MYFGGPIKISFRKETLLKIVSRRRRKFYVKGKVVKCVCLSRDTITRRVEKLDENTKIQLNELCRNFEPNSSAINESTEITDTTQLAIFVRAVASNFNITEELLALCPTKGNCTGAAIFKENVTYDL